MPTCRTGGPAHTCEDVWARDTRTSSAAAGAGHRSHSKPAVACQGQTHQHSCVGPCLWLWPGVQEQLLAPLLSFLQAEPVQNRSAQNTFPFQYSCRARPHHTRGCTHLEQLLGVLAEAMRLAQVQGAKVCVEGLIQLQRSGSRGSGRWPCLPAAALLVQFRAVLTSSSSMQ